MLSTSAIRCEHETRRRRLSVSPALVWFLVAASACGALAQSTTPRARAIRKIDAELPPSAPAQTVNPVPVRSIDTEAWFPEVLTVIHTNRSLFFVPDASQSGRSASKQWQRVLKGGRLKVRKGDASRDERTFVVQSLTTNSVLLGVHGTLQQKRVSLLFLDR